MKQFVSPTGSEIVGTLECLSGVALLNGISANGVPDYMGETDIKWDDQRTVTRDGKILFVDGNGAEWTFDQLKEV